MVFIHCHPQRYIIYPVMSIFTRNFKTFANLENKVDFIEQLFAIVEERSLIMLLFYNGS